MLLLAGFMKKRQLKNSTHDQAVNMAAEISGLINQYTNDSVTSKFFLPEEISVSCYVAAGGFASVIYKTQLEAAEIQKAFALTYFLVLITYGFQIYLKERSIKTNAAPYRLPTNTAYIENASLLVLEKAEKGNLISSPLSDEIIKIILKQLQDNTADDDFKLKGHLLDTKKLNTYMILSLYYGYNLASYLINGKAE